MYGCNAMTVANNCIPITERCLQLCPAAEQIHSRRLRSLRLLYDLKCCVTRPANNFIEFVFTNTGRLPTLYRCGTRTREGREEQGPNSDF